MLGFLLVLRTHDGREFHGDDADNATFDQPLPILERAYYSHDQATARLASLLSIFLIIDLLLLAVYAWRRCHQPSHAGYDPGPITTHRFDLESQSSSMRP
jgi:hypothetical protein